MQSFTLDYKFSLDDFKDMEDIEHDYFIDENVSKAEEVFKWYEKNDLTCVGVRNEEGKVIASINILPLKYEIYKDIYENKMNEADIIADQIEEYEDNKTYYMYLSSISMDINYRNNQRVLLMLIRGALKLFNILDKRNISIKEVMADASTKYGRKICEKILKMKFITDTSHSSKIYAISGIEFVNILNRLIKLTAY